MENTHSPSSSDAQAETYDAIRSRLSALILPDTDWIAAMATVACELHCAFDDFHWTGFYRVISDERLQVGPYQGGHGCLDIAFGRGVCGTAAQERRTIRLGDVASFPGHIACSASTVSEIVVPVMNNEHRLVAVLDVDSDLPNAFSDTDQAQLEQLCEWLGQGWAPV